MRPKILSAHYSGYQVLEGGQGAGTVAKWKLQATKSRVARRQGQRRRRRPHRHREGRELVDGDQLDRRAGRTRLHRHRQDLVAGRRRRRRASSRRPSRRWVCAGFRPRCWTTSRRRSRAPRASRAPSPASAPAGRPGTPAMPRTTASAYFCRPSGGSHQRGVGRVLHVAAARRGSTDTAPGSARRCPSARIEADEPM